ncbi:MAG: VWA domain-containing protein [Proteobacteria bacterium]|nr:VWA domain-containing protein [Pseudomonadota bacterium]MBI3499334.1 VWA domain-containing protein [Pseudomonadota bacterium]
MPAIPAPSVDGGRLVANVMYFGRVLRAAGLPVGPGRVLDAIRAVEQVGIDSRADFYWALHAALVNRRDQREIFDQAFHVFWRNPKIMERLMAMVMPEFRGPGIEDEVELSRRVADALKAGIGEAPPLEEEDKDQLEIDATLTWSDREVLRGMDFEKMSAEDVRRAQAAIRRIALAIHEVPTRRFRPDSAGTRPDPRATLRAALRSPGDFIPLKHRRRRTRHPPLVALCDISGSMSRYSRLFLHFLHAVTNDRDRVHTFLFGTRLTNVTRHLRHRDIDLALAKVADAVEDWSGGTRIGATVHAFNASWGRRVLGQGAVVLLISDGLDREAGAGLAEEMQRLHKSCRRLIWLNPLLRYEGFAPKSMGVRAILPHVDEFRPVHDLASLEQLAEALSRPAPPRRLEAARAWTEELDRAGSNEGAGA